MIKDLRRNFSYYVFSFFVVTMSAWFLEIVYSLVFRMKLVNPGTLSGPWCPIYGITFIFCMLLLRNKDNRFYNFMKIFVIATIIEYLASFISGEIFHNIIWDYNQAPFNINGRVCLHMSLFFTISGYFAIYFIEPLLRRVYIKFGRGVLFINITLVTLFIFDILYNIFI